MTNVECGGVVDSTPRYADLLEDQRLSECHSMAKHVRKGLSMVIPISVRLGKTT